MPFANVQGPDENGVRLQWARDSHVQIVAAPFIEGMPEEGTLNTAYWASLDRYSINQLMKHLRCARDQAFGKDE